MNRRTFILSTTASLVAGCATSDRGAGFPIVDTHTHFYDPSRPQGVPWPDKNDKVLYRTILPEELKRMAEPLGVKGTVVVEASPLIEDNAWILHLAKSEPFILGFVGHLKPGQPNFARDLDRFAGNPIFKGIRIGGWDIPMDAQQSSYLADLQLVEQHGLSVDVLGGPDQLKKIAQIATALPGLPLIINHCAGVHIDGQTPKDDWAQGIREVAAHPHVYMKVSGLPEGTGKEFTAPRDLDFYRPTLDVLWNSFGQDRLIFGSNWPVSARFATYQTVLEIVQAYFREKPAAARRKYFAGNAERIYRVRLS